MPVETIHELSLRLEQFPFALAAQRINPNLIPKKAPSLTKKKVLFKFTTTTPPEKRKVLDSTFKKYYPAINRNTMWQTIEPYIEQADQEYIIPFIGQAQYDIFSESTENTPVLEQLRTASAYYTIFYALPFLNTTIGDLGVMQNEGTDTQTMAANQWRYYNTQLAAGLKGDKALDQALHLLYAGAYPDFDKAVEKKYKKSDFFSHPSDLDLYVNIQGSFRTFNAMTPYLRRAEQKRLLPILCDSQYAALLQPYSQENDTLYTRLHELSSALVAEYATVEATRKLHLLVRDTGFVITSHTDSMTLRKNAADTRLAAIEALRQESITNASNNESDLIQFLIENKDKLPLWANSKCAPDNINCDMITTSGHGAIII